MSDDGRDDFALFEDDREYHPDFGQRPQSKGAPRSLVVAVAIGVILIFSIGAGVILNSGFGHHWPSVTTLRVPLK